MGETAEKPSSSRLPRQVWILAGVGFLIAVGFGVMNPVLPVYARSFGVSSFLIGLVISSLSMVRLVTMPASSWLTRMLGPREMAIAGNVLVAFTTFMMGITNSYLGLLTWRGLSGFGSALYGVSSMALLFASTPPQMRGRASSISGGGFILGGMTGPAIGGLISAISLHAPFFFYAGSLSIAAVVLAVSLPRTGAEQKLALRDNTVGLRDLVKDSRFRAVILVHFGTGWQSFGVRNMLVPLFVVEALKMPMWWAGIAFSCAAVAQALSLHFVGSGTDRLGRRFMIVTGGLLTASMSIALAFSGNYVMLVIWMCLYSVGVSATISASQAMLADAVPVSASSGIAAYQMAGDIGLILGPLIAGAVLDVFSLGWAWVLGAIVILVGVVATWFTPRGQVPMSH
ncbi:MAG: MFS transporter [Propionibacteriaceae bacterium]|nr:MFS transporter [Propionibacteriaceae bacterium]